MRDKFLKGMRIFLGCGTLAAIMPVAAGAEPMEEIWEYTQQNENSYIVYAFKEVELKLPKTWEGKYEMKVEDESVGFFHRDSLEAGNQDGEEGCGALFWLNYSEDYGFVENTPEYYLVGSGSKGVYYITVPGDLHGYQKDEGILNEWMKMSGEVEEIRKNADSQNPGAPMYTTDAVNFRDKDEMESKVLDVIPSDSEVWVTGNFVNGWAQVNYNGEDGYVKMDYLEFPDDISAYLPEDAGESDRDNSYDNDAETEEETAGAGQQEDSADLGTVSKTNDSDIPYQGADGAILYDSNGDSVLVEQADDGYWYDETGVCYGYWEYIQDAGITGAPITNENGETYYWTAQN